MEKDDSHSGRPVPTPRSAHKTSSLTETLSEGRPMPVKPPIASKPKVGPKPAVIAKVPSHEDGHQRMSRTSRPLSIKVTDDGVHTKVASELTAILGRPRSGSKGLLSPVKYDEQPADGEAAQPHEQLTSPVKNMGVAKPVPRARQLPSPSAPSAAASAPTRPPPAAAASTTAGHPPTAAASTTAGHQPAAAACTTAGHQPAAAASTTAGHQPAADVSTTAVQMPAQVDPADSSSLSAGEGSVKKAKPARPPPPTVKRPPPPSVTRSPSQKLADSESNGRNEKKPEHAHHPQPPRKRLEITVLGAKPMAEVGFRDVQGVAKMPPKVTATGAPASHNERLEGLKAASTTEKAPHSHSADAVMKTRVDNPKSVSAPTGERLSANTSNRKPTIIRPSRKPVTEGNVDTNSSELKDGRPASEPREVQNANTQRTTNSPEPPRKPPHSLPVKKDPWGQIAKGPGPTDNLAFSSGDTPPPKSHSLSIMQTLSNQETNEDTSHPDSFTSASNHAATSRSMAAISESAHSPVADTSMFFQSMSADSTPVASKPSALQRIYEAKRDREESQPNKYKHRADCYIDKPNVDTNFWKPGNDSHESQVKASDRHSKKGAGAVPLVAYAAFAFHAKEPNDLSLKAGEEVKVLAKIDKEWLYGEAGGRMGVFPSLYVTVSDDEIMALPLHALPRCQPPSDTVSGQATALFDFTAEHQSELSLKAGEVIVGVEPVDMEWSFGRIADRSGIFPTAFVKLSR